MGNSPTACRFESGSSNRLEINAFSICAIVKNNLEVFEAEGQVQEADCLTANLPYNFRGEEIQMKRNLFDELNEGLTALKSDREGKITLKKCTIEKKPARTIAFVAIRICKIPTH